MSFLPHFTARELEVIQFLVRGMSNGQIALQLSVSTRAIEQHLTHIYEKLGVSSRAQAIVKLLSALKKQ